jgi:hypothetical protein
LRPFNFEENLPDLLPFSILINKNNQSAAEEAAIAAGVESPETKEKLETLQKELEVLKTKGYPHRIIQKIL